jgi:hypothetical protein
MFQIGVNFFPGSPQSLANMQAFPIPEVFHKRREEVGGSGFFILDTGDNPILDTGDNEIEST